MRKPYKLAKPYTGKTGDPKEKWFAYYSFVNPSNGRFERFKVYEGVNEIKDPKEKIKFMKELVSEINKHLAIGYSPFEMASEGSAYIKKKQHEIMLLENPPTPLLLDAMEAFIKKKQEKNNSAKSLKTFRSYINAFEAYLIENRIADMNVTGFTEQFIYKMMSSLKVKHSWGATTFNNYLAFARAMVNFFCAKSQRWLLKSEYEFGEGDLEFKKAKVLKHQYFTDQLTRIVKPELEKDPALHTYAMFLHYSCMRPDEIRHLQISNVDVASRTIKILGKTNNRAIPISDELANIITSLKSENYPTNYYLIGKDGYPSPTMHGSDIFSKKFLAIKKDKNLPDGLTLYGLKHTRIINLVNAGYTDAEIQNLSGHTDTDSYNKYKRDLMGNMISTMRGKTIEW